MAIMISCRSKLWQLTAPLGKAKKKKKSANSRVTRFGYFIAKWLFCGLFIAKLILLGHWHKAHGGIENILAIIIFFNRSP